MESVEVSQANPLPASQPGLAIVQGLRHRVDVVHKAHFDHGGVDPVGLAADLLLLCSGQAFQDGNLYSKGFRGLTTKQPGGFFVVEEHLECPRTVGAFQ